MGGHWGRLLGHVFRKRRRRAGERSVEGRSWWMLFDLRLVSAAAGQGSLLVLQRHLALPLAGAASYREFRQLHHNRLMNSLRIFVRAITPYWQRCRRRCWWRRYNITPTHSRKKKTAIAPVTIKAPDFEDLGFERRAFGGDGASPSSWLQPTFTSPQHAATSRMLV